MIPNKSKAISLSRHSLFLLDESRGLKIIYFHLTRPRYSHWMVLRKIERIIQSTAMMSVKRSPQCVIYKKKCEPFYARPPARIEVLLSLIKFFLTVLISAVNWRVSLWFFKKRTRKSKLIRQNFKTDSSSRKLHIQKRSAPHSKVSNVS